MMSKLIKENELAKYSDSYLNKLKEKNDLNEIAQLTDNLLCSLKTLYDLTNKDSSQNNF
ncbi:hypothetical protein [Cysteiniphilum litorale]|uniref:hypothetical protein n=1 Tax=Cysteiniphilum litorale TaxID=2056700 RepID=UPI003F8810A6